MVIPRVKNSLGPFFSLSKSIPRRVGKSVDWMFASSCKADDVVHSALTQSRVSWRRVSSCSSLFNDQGFDVARLAENIPPFDFHDSIQEANNLGHAPFFEEGIDPQDRFIPEQLA